jgi:hypothetical protein
LETVTLIYNRKLLDGSPPTHLTEMLHRDKQVWGEDPEAFDPDRFGPENRAKIPLNAYELFGTGGARLHRPAVRLAGGDSRAEHALAALRVGRLHQLPARNQADAHH